MSEPADPPSAPLPEDLLIEIHKPKPVHNWRELLTEIGVVVIGMGVASCRRQTAKSECQSNVFPSSAFARSTCPCIGVGSGDAGVTVLSIAAGLAFIVWVSA